MGYRTTILKYNREGGLGASRRIGKKIGLNCILVQCRGKLDLFQWQVSFNFWSTLQLHTGYSRLTYVNKERNILTGKTQGSCRGPHKLKADGGPLNYYYMTTALFQ